MILEEFPNCCGIGVLTGFAYTPKAAGNRAYFKTAIETDKKRLLEEVANQRRYIKSGDDGYGIIMATLNNEQMPEWSKFLKQQGFKRLSTASNPKHNSTLNVFSLTLARTKAKQKLAY